MAPAPAPEIWGSIRKGPVELGIDAFEFAHMCTAGFPEPWTFSLRARRYLREHRTDFDLVHDNQCLGYGIRGIERDGMPVVATLHHPITVDRDLEVAEAKRLKAASSAASRCGAGTGSSGCRSRS